MTTKLKRRVWAWIMIVCMLFSCLPVASAEDVQPSDTDVTIVEAPADETPVVDEDPVPEVTEPDEDEPVDEAEVPEIATPETEAPETTEPETETPAEEPTAPETSVEDVPVVEDVVAVGPVEQLPREGDASPMKLDPKCSVGDGTQDHVFVPWDPTSDAFKNGEGKDARTKEKGFEDGPWAESERTKYNKVVNAGSCVDQTNGMIRKICVLCGQYGYETVKWQNCHDFSGEPEVKEASCTEEGLKTWECQNGCGETITETIAKKPHDYQPLTSEPTCNLPGGEGEACSVCGEPKDGFKETAPALGHKFTEAAVTVQKSATCTQNGYKLLVCSNPNCDGYKVDGKEATGTLSAEIEDVTGLDKGEAEKLDEYMGRAYQKEEIKAAGHDFKDGVTITLAAKCETNGLTVVICKAENCDGIVTDEEKEVLVDAALKEALGDQGAELDSYLEKNVVAQKTVVKAEGHDFSAKDDKSNVLEIKPLCTTVGYTITFCKNDNCDQKLEGDSDASYEIAPVKFEQADIDALKDAQKVDGKDKNGKTLSDFVGKVGVKATVDATNHTFDGEPITVPPTCEMAGLTYTFCTNPDCDGEVGTASEEGAEYVKFSAEDLAAMDKVFKDAPDYDEIEDAEQLPSKLYADKVGKIAKKVTTPATNHKWTDSDFYLADCLNPDRVAPKCSICGKPDNENVKDLSDYGDAALGHDWQWVTYTDAEGGNVHAYVCVRCEMNAASLTPDTYQEKKDAPEKPITQACTFVDDETKAEENVEATCTKKGTLNQICSVCGRTTKVETPMTPHTLEWLPVEDGEVVDEKARECGKVYEYALKCIVEGCDYDGTKDYKGPTPETKYEDENLGREGTEVPEKPAEQFVLPHNFGETYVYTDATCTEKGTLRIYVCQNGNCNAVGENAGDDVMLWSAAKAAHPELDGKVDLPDEKVVKVETPEAGVPALGHTIADEAEKKQVGPSCYVDAYYTYECSTCGDFVEYAKEDGSVDRHFVADVDKVEDPEELAALKATGHKFGEVEDYYTKTDAKCEKAGSIVYYCQNEGCDGWTAEDDEKYPELVNGANGAGKPEESEVITKSVATKTEEIPALEHNWKASTDGDNYREPTCTKNARSKMHCDICGTDKWVDITDGMSESAIPDDWKALGHDFESEKAKVTKAEPTADGKLQHQVVCSRCAVNASKDKDDPDYVTPEELEKEGTKIVACTATGENVVETKATCAAPKKIDYTCDVCGQKWSVTEGVKLESTLENCGENVVIVPLKPATCTKPGIGQQHCTLCDTDHGFVSIPAGAHSFNDALKALQESGDYSAYKGVSGKDEEGKFSWQWLVPIEDDEYHTQLPSCGKTSTLQFTCDLCGGTDTYTVTVQHNFEISTETAPQSGTLGTIVYKCTNSGCSNDSDFLYDSSYDGVTDVMWEYLTSADYDFDGQEGHVTLTMANLTCDAWNALKGLEGEDALQHELKEGAKIAPTHTKPGYTVTVCTICGAEVGEPVVDPEAPATGHTWELVTDDVAAQLGAETAKKAPECGVDGYLYYVCSDPDCLYDYDFDNLVPFTADGEYLEGGYQGTLPKAANTRNKSEENSRPYLKVVFPGYTHDVDELEKVEENRKYYDADCMNPAREVVTCPKCHEVVKVTDLSEFGGEALGHDFTSAVPANVTDEDGNVTAYKHTYTCGRADCANAIETWKKEHPGEEPSFEEGVALNDEGKAVKTENCEFGEGEVTRKATCVAEGEMTYTCPVCKQKKTVTIAIDKTVHNKEDLILKPATCTSNGIKETVCKDCGEIFGYSSILAGHSWELVEEPELNKDYKLAVYGEEDSDTADVRVKTTTCISDGVEVWLCMNCTDADGRKVVEKAATGHNFSAAAQVVEPTGKTLGKAVWLCQNPDCEYDAAKDNKGATGSMFGKAIVTVTFVCGEKNVGGTVDGIKVPYDSTSSHSYTEIENVEPTCTTPGLEGGKQCENCGTLDGGTVVDPIGHKFELQKVDDCTVTSPRYVCTNEGCTLGENEDLVKGKYEVKYDAEEGKAYYEIGVQEAHKLVAPEEMVDIPADCEYPVRVEQLCEYCEHSEFVTDYDPDDPTTEDLGPLGHWWVKDDPTATGNEDGWVANPDKPGWEIRYCYRENCPFKEGEANYSQERKCTDPDNWYDTTVNGKVTDSLPEGWDADTTFTDGVATKPATCADPMKHLSKCLTCGQYVEYTEGKAVPDAHVEETKILKAPTCANEATNVTGKGIGEIVCKLCGKVRGYESLPALTEHKDVQLRDVYIGNNHLLVNYCATCGKIIPNADTDNGIIVFGHSKQDNGTYFTDDEIIAQEVTFDCTKGYLTYATDKKFYLEHTPVTVEAYPATSTTKGHTEGEVCKYCGTILSGCEEVEWVEHECEIDPDTTSTVAATCTVNAKTVGKCKVCGKKMEIEEPDTFTGHTWKLDVSTKPDNCEKGWVRVYVCQNGDLCDGGDGTAKDTIVKTGEFCEEIDIFEDDTSWWTNYNRVGGVGVKPSTYQCGSPEDTSWNPSFGSHRIDDSQPPQKKDATCLEHGYSGYVCQDCGQVIEGTYDGDDHENYPDYIPPKGHEWEEYNTSSLATPDEWGAYHGHYRICTREGCPFNTFTGPKHLDYYGAGMTTPYNQHGDGDDDNFIFYVEGDFFTGDENCTLIEDSCKGGLYGYYTCEVCGYSSLVTIFAGTESNPEGTHCFNPNAKKTVQAPTCTKEGKYEAFCMLCHEWIGADKWGESINAPTDKGVLAPLGHDFKMNEDGTPAEDAVEDVDYVLEEEANCLTPTTYTYFCAREDCDYDEEIDLPAEHPETGKMVATKVMTTGEENPDVHSYTGDLGEDGYPTTEADGHVDATCSTPGYDYWDCKWCEAPEARITKETEEANGKHSEQTGFTGITEKNDLTPYTSTTLDGDVTVQFKYCELCGEILSVIGPFGGEEGTFDCTKVGLDINGGTDYKYAKHDFEGVEPETKAATCENAGYTDRQVCNVCKTATGTTEPAKGHKYVKGEMVEKATCTKAAVYTWTCSNSTDEVCECEHPTKQDVDPEEKPDTVNGHDYVKAVAEDGSVTYDETKAVVTPGTCVDRETTVYTCTLCTEEVDNHTKKVEGELDPTNHAGEPEPDLENFTDATDCTHPGKITFKCPECQQTIPELEEDVEYPGAKQDDDGNYVHTYPETDDEIKEQGRKVEDANCQHGEMYEVTCSVCGQGTKTVEVGEPNGTHVYDEAIPEAAEADVPATCVATGLKKGAMRCSKCHEAVRPEDVLAIDTVNGHKYDTGVETLAPKCTQDGVKTYTCQNEGCKDANADKGYTKTETITKLGHNYVKSVAEDGTVTYDDSKITAEKKPTCVEEGSKTYTCDREGCTPEEADHEKTIVVEKMSEDGKHSWGDDDEADWAVDPEDETKEKRTCTVCGTVETREAKPVEKKTGTVTQTCILSKTAGGSEFVQLLTAGTKVTITDESTNPQYYGVVLEGGVTGYVLRIYVTIDE